MEHVGEQRRAPCHPAADRGGDPAPVVSHFVAAGFFRPLLGDPLSLRAKVRQERIGLMVDCEAQLPRTFPIRHARTPWMVNPQLSQTICGGREARHTETSDSLWVMAARCPVAVRG